MIKKLFQVIGLLVLVCASFIYTEKAAIVVRDHDPLMIELNEKKDNYYISAKDALIDGNTIIPGYRGIEVDVKTSYENMKKYGMYNESMLKFREVIPSVTIDNIYDKYIESGNKLKGSVSLIFKVNKNDDLTKIIEVLNGNNVTATFFVDKSYIESNKDILKELNSLGNEINHINYTNDEDFTYSNRLINNITSSKQKYCYTDTYDDKILNSCKNYSMHVVKPIKIKSINTLISIKKILSAGNIIELSINNTSNEELDHIIKYIKQKGLEITTIKEHLSEKRLVK